MDSPEIPILKKREKDRKAGGIGWYMGSGGGGTAGLGAGSQAAASAVARGFLGSGRMAAALSNLFGGPGTLIGGVFASKFGGALSLAGVALWAGLVGGAGLRLMGAFGLIGGSAAGNISLSLGALARSGIVIDSPGNKSLGFLARANEGEVEWAGDAAAQDSMADAADGADAGGAADAADGADPGDMAGEEGEADPGAGTGKLSSTLEQKVGKGFNFNLSGELGGSGSGAHLSVSNPAAAAAAAAKAAELAQAGKDGKTGQKLSENRKMSALKRARGKLQARNINKMMGRSNRAMGQLKFARGMSAAAAGSAGESETKQKGFATDAFEQGVTQGGELGGGIGLAGSGNEPVVPVGSGVPPELDPGAMPGAPDVGEGMNATPYQDALDSAKGLGDMSGMLKLISIALIAAGVALIAMASGPWAAILIAIGLALIAVGVMMFMMALKMAGMAAGIGDMIDTGYGQEDQGEIVDECAHNSANTGQNIEACRPSNTPEVNDRNTVHEDAETEASSTFNVQ